MSADALTHRSTFVTVLAWLAIVFSGISLFTSALQALTIFFGFGLDGEGMVAFLLVIVAMSMLSILGLTSGVGLLKRRGWARYVMLGLLGFAGLWQLGSLLAFTIFDFGLEDVPTDEELQAFTTILRGGVVVFTLVVCTLSAFAIYKLTRREIRDEFDAGGFD